MTSWADTQVGEPVKNLVAFTDEQKAAIWHVGTTRVPTTTTGVPS